MAITSAISSGPYTGTGSQTAFPFSFSALSSTDVVVSVNGVVASTGYTVSIATGGNSGTVTFAVAPASGAVVLIEQVPDFIQDSQYGLESNWSLASVNAINRRAAMRSNWLKNTIAQVGIEAAASADAASASAATATTKATEAAAYAAAAEAASLGMLDTDGTLAANSDTRLASQKAVKSYVDNKVAGLSWKRAVRAATTAAGTLATSFANGSVIDGVTLATGDRILLKNQSAVAENGIYTVNASGAPTRADDADTGGELVNASVYVSEGTTLADTQWTCSTNAPITPGATALTFVQAGATGGAVSSVGLSLPAMFTVSGSPITSSGTLTATLANQNANLVFAGPSSGTASAPTFRALVSADMPPAIQSVTSAATVTPTFANDQVNITAQAVGLTLANPTGTAVDGFGMVIRIKDNGTARTIAYGTNYRALGVTLPTTTVIGKTLYLGMIYNAADTKWDIVSVAQQA